MLSTLALLAAVTIPPYPGATALCSQHVTGAPIPGQPAGHTGPTITWTAFYTPDTPETVVSWYQQRLAPGLHRRQGKEDVWRIPADEPEAALSVTAVADAPPPVAACKERPPATARAILLMSTMQRPAKAGAALAKGAIVRSFASAGITKVILRAGDADAATVTVSRGGTAIEVSGLPTGGAKGYHPSNPNWRETAAAEWGLDFVSERRGPVLVVSTKNEMRYIHHHYHLASVAVRVPPGVEVVKEKRELTGDGKPDLH
jgi:hypothetical protein